MCAFEVACEMAAVGDADLHHYVLDRQGRPLHEEARSGHAQPMKKGTRRVARLGAEQSRELGHGQADRGGHFRNGQSAMQLLLHSLNCASHSIIHCALAWADSKSMPACISGQA